ncbi:putative RNA methyltransferase [Clostridium thermopalmarium]|uniref:23S rRNA (Guanine(745)-N(1))-methyltransferase n=1 Tax=Clostridium thermopalmarium DSM 5974 TaxID=1121340 RepID=A0A2T0APS3_9CLOT|nr:methyltransferase domain-containing protein [Clostridium thermopalmarium]PRR71010.1 23S rRNA (guanine(745)-N(1))-methyltransferase [Clostridium thermopalmarium DSM 5974]PVZ23650.1 23S rRNA (guanine745-N1)-methyltransferase [Clostridium thermopalmarium DSM 5974]
MCKNKIQENIGLFKCPICGNKMDLYNLKSLICPKNHCFDLSKTGYVNFLLNSVKTQYDKEMLKSRNIVCKNSFFEPMVEQVSEIILRYISNVSCKKSMILDAGCGEGSHLNQVINKLNDKSRIKFDGIGIDISKEGIKIASKEYPDNIWCVGDLAKTPFMNKKFDVILNILSPSNYSEFNRIISDRGILIKVVPGSSYLKELRGLFYGKTDKQEYSNEKVLRHFNNNFHMIHEQQILYTVELDKEYLEQLIKMTPLSWNASKDKIQRAFNIGLENITVDFTIICGKKN